MRNNPALDSPIAVAEEAAASLGVGAGAQPAGSAPGKQSSAEELYVHLTAIVESSDDAILSKDLNGVIQSWNKGAERIFGYQASETIGHPVTMLIPEGRQDEEPNILSRIRRGDRIDHYETVRQRKDGSLVNISLTVSPIKDASGKIVGASKIARDITERKRTEQALKTARDELAELNKTLEERIGERTKSLNEAMAQMQEFSYSVSHDLRAPVRAMQGYARAILEDHLAELSPTVAHHVQRICRGSSRMDKLIRDVLVYSRLATNKIEFKPVALGPFIEDVLAQYPELQPPQVEIHIHKPLLTVQAQESLLTQIISNLLTNATKFVKPGVVPRLEIWTERPDHRVRLWIKDNGIGIAPQHRGRVFGMFERVHEEGRYEGTGIGLAIVRKAVEKMGGAVGLESDGTNGSSFWIELEGED